jgi:hypothetical protein
MKPWGTGALIAVGMLVLAATLGRHSTDAAIATPRTTDAAFVVSSSADAGPGTLRDAILAADRLGDSARISIAVRRIALETALPPLINPRGITLGGQHEGTVIDAGHQPKGATLQILSPTSVIHDLSIVNSHDFAVLVAAPGVELRSLTVSDSKTAVVIGAAARGASIRTSTFERDETAISAETGVRDLVIQNDIFRGNTRAGFWFVGSVDKDASMPVENVRITDSVFDRNASGVVLANRPASIQKSRFIDNHESAILVLGGAARIEDNEIHGSGTSAISVSSGRHVNILRNVLHDNPATAIMVRDSEAEIAHNTLQHNGTGIVVITSHEADVISVSDNTVSRSKGDGLTIIGGMPTVARNQLLDNAGAGIRSLDLVHAKGGLKAAPHLDANQLRGNGIDMPSTGVYKIAGMMPPS